MSSNIINKIAKAGIDNNILKQTFHENGIDGIRILFSESVNGKPRVTTNKKIIEKVCRFLTVNI